MTELDRQYFSARLFSYQHDFRKMIKFGRFVDDDVQTAWSVGLDRDLTRIRGEFVHPISKEEKYPIFVLTDSVHLPEHGMFFPVFILWKFGHIELVLEWFRMGLHENVGCTLAMFILGFISCISCFCEHNKVMEFVRVLEELDIEFPLLCMEFVQKLSNKDTFLNSLAKLKNWEWSVSGLDYVPCSRITERSGRLCNADKMLGELRKFYLKSK